MLSNHVNENNNFWKSTWEHIAQMKAEIRGHKDFLKFMQEESERMKLEEVLANQLNEQETIRK